MEAEAQSRKFTGADLIAFAVAALFVAVLFLNPDEDLLTRTSLLIAGVMGMGLGWYWTRGRSWLLKVVAIPGLTFVFMLIVGVVVDLVQL